MRPFVVGIVLLLGLWVRPSSGRELPTHHYLETLGATKAENIFFHPDTGIRHSIIVAVIDSGLDLQHRDLKHKLWINTAEIPGNGIDDDANGYIDDVNGYNVASRRASPSFEKTKENGGWQWAHGTKVAGLAVSLCQCIRIMALNNLGRDRYMDHAHTAEAIRYAVNNGAQVVNLSLGGSSRASTKLREAIEYAVAKRVVVVAAAGNNAKEISSHNSAAGLASSLQGLISIANIVAATSELSPTSNYSSQYVELGAPGMGSSKGMLPTLAPGNRYEGFSGTSAATPLVAGAASLAIGLIQSRGYAYSAADIEDLLVRSARKVRALRPFIQAGGILDLARLAHLVDTRYPARPGTQPPGRRVANLAELAESAQH